MYYFKKLNINGELDSLQSSLLAISNCDSDLIPIAEDEFNEINAELVAKAAEAEAAAEQEYQDYVAQLEEENAALLFQLLTGEEMTDV